MPAKTQIVEFLGDKALVLPSLLDAAIVGNERASSVSSRWPRAMPSIRKRQVRRLFDQIARPAGSAMPDSIAACAKASVMDGATSTSPVRNG